jgi:glutamine synthetase adenylyltransferase
MRHLEHRLQFDEDRQTHTLPETDKRQLDLLARKMPPGFRGCPAPARCSANWITISPACRICMNA